MSGCSCGRDPAGTTAARLIGQRAQVRQGWTERTVGTITDADAIGIVLKTLTSQECVAPFYRPNKNAPKFNTHVWVFERQQPLTYDSTHKIVDIYIKVTIDFENHVTVISFHQKRNRLKGEKKHGKN